MRIHISIYNHGRGTGEGSDRKSVDRVPKTMPEKSAIPEGKGTPSGFQNGGKKARKTSQGHPAVAEEKKGRKRSVNERPHMSKPGLSCERGCENQEMRVYELHEKKLGKGVVKRAGIT